MAKENKEDTNTQNKKAETDKNVETTVDDTLDQTKVSQEQEEEEDSDEHGDGDGDGNQNEDKELENVQNELIEIKDKYLRLYSEFENFRRRTAREKLELLQTANEELMISLLPVLDDCDRAVNAFAEETDIKAVKEGVKLVASKFKNTLQQQGLMEMDSKVGSDFDSDLHDAITQIPAPKKKLKGKIVDTVERGYSIGEKVIRHAKVVIGN